MLPPNFNIGMIESHFFNPGYLKDSEGILPLNFMHLGSILEVEGP